MDQWLFPGADLQTIALFVVLSIGDLTFPLVMEEF